MIVESYKCGGYNFRLGNTIEMFIDPRNVHMNVINHNEVDAILLSFKILMSVG